MRLIDADALEKDLEEFWGIPKDWDGQIAEPYAEAFCAIDQMLTVDAEPVVHGRWNNQSFSLNGGRVLLFTCSECNHEQGGESNYCPNCGAKMDGERRSGDAER